MIWRGIVFLVTTAFLVYVSRASLRRPRSHGFFRFIAWEIIVAMFLLNITWWFRDPLAWNQLIAWFLLAACLVPGVWGVVLLRSQGKPAEERPSDDSLVAFEKTTQLVTSGIYRYIRHPLYSSLLLLTWGIFFKHPSWVGGSLGLASTLFLILTALADEAECAAFFGEEYVAYKRRTRRFIPFVF
ncbi:methyltransferase family protein [Myxococcota bacterium]